MESPPLEIFKIHLDLVLGSKQNHPEDTDNGENFVIVRRPFRKQWKKTAFSQEITEVVNNIVSTLPHFAFNIWRQFVYTEK